MAGSPRTKVAGIRGVVHRTNGAAFAELAGDILARLPVILIALVVLVVHAVLLVLSIAGLEIGAMLAALGLRRSMPWRRRSRTPG